METLETIASMLEMIIVSLLVWLWVIERRLNGLRESVQSIKLDGEGTKLLVNSEITNFRAELGDLLGTPQPQDTNNATS